VIWLVAGVVLYLVARAQMKKISGMPQTTETVRQVPNALKGHEERNQGLPATTRMRFERTSNGRARH
jgi:hypothetical protein